MADDKNFDPRESTEGRNRRLFEEAGCTPEYVAKSMAEVIGDPGVRLYDIRRDLHALGIVDGYLKDIMEKIKAYAGSKSLSLDYIKEYNRMIGNLAPSKREVTGKDGGPLTFSGMFTQMDDVELMKATEKYFKRYAMLTGKTIKEDKKPWSDLL